MMALGVSKDARKRTARAICGTAQKSLKITTDMADDGEYIQLYLTLSASLPR